MTIEKQLADALRDALNELNSRHPVPHDGMIAMANALAAYDARPVAGDEQVERVARAIYEAGPPIRDYRWHDLTQFTQVTFYKKARAAIAALPPQVSPDLIEKLGKLANYLTEQGEYDACDLIDTVVERLTPKAKG